MNVLNCDVCHKTGKSPDCDLRHNPGGWGVDLHPRFDSADVGQKLIPLALDVLVGGEGQAVGADYVTGQGRVHIVGRRDQDGVEDLKCFEIAHVVYLRCVV